MSKKISKTINYKFLSLNETINKSRTNVYMANNFKKKEMEVVRLSTIGMKKITEYPVKITFNWHIKNKARDLDNCIPKNIIDALVASKILINDSVKYINEINHKYIEDKEDFVEFVIEY